MHDLTGGTRDSFRSVGSCPVRAKVFSAYLEPRVTVPRPVPRRYREEGTSRRFRSRRDYDRHGGVGVRTASSVSGGRVGDRRRSRATVPLAVTETRGPTLPTSLTSRRGVSSLPSKGPQTPRTVARCTPRCGEVPVPRVGAGFLNRQGTGLIPVQDVHTVRGVTGVRVVGRPRRSPSCPPDLCRVVVFPQKDRVDRGLTRTPRRRGQ